MKTLDDNELLDLFSHIETQKQAFDMLIAKYQKQVYFLIRRMVIIHEDADDLTQDTFIKVWQNLSHFNRQSKFYTWIYRIAVNETITFLNKKKRFYYLPLIHYEESLANSLKADPLFNGDKIELLLQKAILTLPQKQRLVFNMKYYDNMKYEDMSKILGTSVGALKASYHLAVNKIEKFMNSY